MMTQNIIAIVLISLGFIFMLISAVGLFRFPDFYTRLHSTGIGDTLGSLLILLGLIVLIGAKLLSLKIVLIAAILIITSPIGTNLIMSAAIHKHDYEGYNEMISEDDLAERKKLAAEKKAAEKKATQKKTRKKKKPTAKKESR